jgi:hypothetical protein
MRRLLTRSTAPDLETGKKGTATMTEQIELAQAGVNIAGVALRLEDEQDRDHLADYRRRRGLSDSEAPEDELRAWSEGYGRTTINGKRIDPRRVERNTRTLRGLILLAGTVGQAEQPSLSKVAGFVGQKPEVAARAIESLLEMPEPPISVEDPHAPGEPGSLETRRWRVVTSIKRPDGKAQRIVDPEEDFEQRPIFTILDPKLVAIERDQGCLRDWIDAILL